MLHNRTTYRPQGDHYAASVSLNEQGGPSYVLAQLQENGEQARVVLTKDEARHFAALLLKAVERVEAHEKAEAELAAKGGS